MNTPSNGLVLFTRFPEVGKAKTRLIPHLGARQAAALQRRMTEHIMNNLRPLLSQHFVTLEVHFAGGTVSDMRNWLGHDLTYQTQASGNLGDRLQQVFQQGFDHRLERIVVIGADCPDLSVKHVEQAFQLLDSHDVVLGPAHDGGYYLIGLSGVCPDLFHNISWSTQRVFAQTVAIATRLHLSLAMLEPLGDIDRPEDLVILPQALAAL